MTRNVRMSKQRVYDTKESTTRDLLIEQSTGLFYYPDQGKGGFLRERRANIPERSLAYGLCAGVASKAHRLAVSSQRRSCPGRPAYLAWEGRDGAGSLVPFPGPGAHGRGTRRSIYNYQDNFQYCGAKAVNRAP